MTEHIGPLPRLFRGMADRIDQDRLSPTRAEAIGNAAAVAVARAAAEGMVGGRLWDDDGAALLAAGYVFHAGRSRQTAVAAHSAPWRSRAHRGPVTSTNPPASPSHRAGRAAATPQPGPLSRLARRARDPRRWIPMACPGHVWGSWMRPRRPGCGGCWQSCAAARSPRGQLLRLTHRLPVELAAQLLSVLDGGPALVRAEAVRVLEAADPQNPATPALAVVVVGWLEAAEQALAAGASAQELQVLLGVAGQEGNLG